MASASCFVPAPPLNLRFHRLLIPPPGIRSSYSSSSSSNELSFLNGAYTSLFSGTVRRRRRNEPVSFRCSAANEQSSSETREDLNHILPVGGFLSCIDLCQDVDFREPVGELIVNAVLKKRDMSSTAKIRSEVLSPFRSLRMFFYLAFIASGALGGIIALTQLISSLAISSKAAQIPEILGGIGVDVGAVLIFSFLYSWENKAKNAQIARLSREESLSNLKLRIDDKNVIPVSYFRGIARLVILSGPASFISESFRRSLPFSESLLDRGVLIVPFPTDGNLPEIKIEDSEEEISLAQKKRRLWQLTPVYATEWSKWLDEQKEMANVALDSPVYLSLRVDGRVRGSGVGYPPWNALVAQLPPVKGIWTGLLDGMDGRVL